jgi:hypothetical protein
MSSACPSPPSCELPISTRSPAHTHHTHCAARAPCLASTAGASPRTCSVSTPPRSQSRSAGPGTTSCTARGAPRPRAYAAAGRTCSGTAQCSRAPAAGSTLAASTAAMCPRAGSPMGHRRAPGRTPRSVLPCGQVRPPPFEARIAARTQEDDRFHVVEVRRPRLPLPALAPDVVDLLVHECACRAPAQRERVLDHARSL